MLESKADVSMKERPLSARIIEAEVRGVRVCAYKMGVNQGFIIYLQIALLPQ